MAKQVPHLTQVVVFDGKICTLSIQWMEIRYQAKGGGRQLRHREATHAMLNPVWRDLPDSSQLNASLSFQMPLTADISSYQTPRVKVLRGRDCREDGVNAVFQRHQNARITTNSPPHRQSVPNASPIPTRFNATRRGK